MFRYGSARVIAWSGWFGAVFCACSAGKSPATRESSNGGGVTIAGSGGQGAQSNAGGSGAALNIAGSSGAGSGVSECAGGVKTVVRGTVRDPGGKLPLYNVMLYVPSAPLDAIKEGVSCERCDATASGLPVAAALTDAKGEFVLEDVPSGTNVPLVIQMGKWRREITLAEVKACQENLVADTDLLRLPRNQSEGHLPKIAMTAGEADKLECMMRRIGIADSEFTNPDGPGRVNIYYETGSTEYAAGGTFPPVSNLIGSLETLKQYDMVIMSCHGESARGREQPTSEKETVKAYLDLGGRVFGSHFHYSYLRGDDDNHLPTPFPKVANWDGDSPESYSIETSFPKGQAFADWLLNVGASTSAGSIALQSVEGPAMTLLTAHTQRWIYAPNSAPYFTMNTPVEKIDTPDEQCGRFVHTGIHISGSEEEAPFPSGCEDREMTAQEKALAFLIFDLSACPLRYDAEPEPPPVVK